MPTSICPFVSLNLSSDVTGVIRYKHGFSTAPDDDLLPVVSYYWGLGLNDKKIVEHALHHFDKSVYGLR
jgi:hypothetical protein